MKSTWVSTSQRISKPFAFVTELTPTRAVFANTIASGRRPGEPSSRWGGSLDELEPGVRSERTAHFPRQAAVSHHHVAGEVVLSPDQRGAHPVGVDRHTAPLELLD